MHHCPFDLPLLEGHPRKAKAGLPVDLLQWGDGGLSLPYDPLSMQRKSPASSDRSLSLFRPSGRAAVILSLLAIAAVGFALYLRYGIIQNTPIGLACEAGEQSLTCTARLAAIHLFVRSIFGWTAVAAALFQLWRPNVVVLGIGLVSAAFGLVLYNTRLSALAVALLVLSFARAWPGTR
jgi:hypothetical protein